MRYALKGLLSELFDWTNPIRLGPTSDNEVALLAVTSGYLRLAIRYGETATILVDAGLGEQIAPAERSLRELRCEMSLLARRPSRLQDAIKIQVFDLLEFLDGFADLPERWDELRREAAAELAKYEIGSPAIVDAMRMQRANSGGRKHWSGGNRSSVYANGPTARRLYRTLSWEAHPGMAVSRSVVIDRDELTTVKFDDQDAVSQVGADKAAAVTAKLLWNVWIDFARIWQLPIRRERDPTE